MQFRELFLQIYAGTEPLAATVINLLNGLPKEGECLSLYGSRMATSAVSQLTQVVGVRIGSSLIYI